MYKVNCLGMSEKLKYLSKNQICKKIWIIKIIYSTKK